MAVKISEYRGVERLYAAEVTEVTTMVNGEEVTEEQYGTPFRLAGVQEISNELSESSETHYYDNIGAIVVDSEGDDTFTLTVSVPSLKTRAIIEGTTYDEATGSLIGTPKYRKYFAIGFIGNKLNGEDEYVWVLKGKFTGGGATHSTQDDGTDATNIQYTFTSIYTSKEFDEVVDEDGLPQAVKNITVEGNSRTDVSKWFDQVVTPANISSIAYASIDVGTASAAPQDDEEIESTTGRPVSSFQSADTTILEDGRVVGTLYHVTGFTWFNESDPTEQEGYYFVCLLGDDISGTNLTIRKNDETEGKTVAFDAPQYIILRVVSTGTVFHILVDGVEVLTLDFSTINFD